MRRTVCGFTVATLICAATYETCHAAPIAPLTGIQATLRMLVPRTDPTHIAVGWSAWIIAWIIMGR